MDFQFNHLIAVIGHKRDVEIQKRENKQRKLKRRR